MINSAHNKNHNEGRVFTKNHKRKISEANKRRKGMKFKKTHNIPISELKDKLRANILQNIVIGLLHIDESA